MWTGSKSFGIAVCRWSVAGFEPWREKALCKIGGEGLCRLKISDVGVSDNMNCMTVRFKTRGGLMGVRTTVLMQRVDYGWLWCKTFVQERDV